MPTGPFKLTPDVTARLVEAFAVGAYHQDAAAYAGISDETLRQWLQKGQEATEAGDAPNSYAALYAAVQQATVTCKIDIMRHWHSKATRGKGYLAARDFLARRYSDEWGDSARLHIEHSGTIENRIEITVLTANDLSGIAGLLSSPEQRQLGTGQVIDQAPESEL